MGSTDFSLSKYKKLDVIGRGFFGIIYTYNIRKRSKEKGLPEIIAVKSILKLTTGCEKYIKREMSVLLSLKHENVVRFFGVEDKKKETLFKMELANCDLSKLKEKMKIKSYYPYEFYFLASQIMTGLAYLHSKSIAHRDLKPKNILAKWDDGTLTGPPLLYSISLKLCDFGLSREVPDESASATAVGSKRYMAPEVAKAFSQSEVFRGNYKKADVFSAGVVLYEMYHDEQPFTFAELSRGVEKKLKFCEEEVRDTMIRMLRWKRNKRHTAIEIAELLKTRQRPKATQTQIEEFETACSSGDLAEAKWLIDSDCCPVDLPRENDQTPLHMACWHGHRSIARMLLDRGARVSRGESRGWTPLHIVCFRGDLSLAKLLIGRGAEVNKADNYGMTPLHYACREGKLDVAQLLVKKDTFVNLVDNKGMTSLNWACYFGLSSLALFLIENGAEVNKADIDGMTPLRWACCNGHPTVAKMLFERGADSNIVDKNGWTPMHSACFNGHHSVVDLLIVKGADIDRPDDEGFTPLHLACGNGHLSVVQLLVLNGAELKKANSFGSTALHCACDKGNLSIVTFLVEIGTKVNVADEDGFTPLHLACENGHLRISDFLLRSGAEKNTRNRNNETPLDVAPSKMKVQFFRIFYN